MQINWYPGHMAKAKREMERMIKVSDVAVEIVDARAPLSTRNPDLDKMLGAKPRSNIFLIGAGTPSLFAPKNREDGKNCSMLSSGRRSP